MMSEQEISNLKEILCILTQAEYQLCFTAPTEKSSMEWLRLWKLAEDKHKEYFPNRTKEDFEYLMNNARPLYAEMTHQDIMCTFSGRREIFGKLINK